MSKKVFLEGYMDNTIGAAKESCPYDPMSQPKQYKAWISGWKAASFDAKHATTKILKIKKDD